MPIDWSRFERDIEELYFRDNKSVKETVAVLNSRYNCNMKTRQFKLKYNGSKNIKAEEWKAISEEVHNRRIKGKAWNVYLNGRLQDPSRVEKEIQRYSNMNVANPRGQRVIGIETTNQYRVEIRTPATHRLTEEVDPISVSPRVAADSIYGEIITSQAAINPNIMVDFHQQSQVNCRISSSDIGSQVHGTQESFHPYVFDGFSSSMQIDTSDDSALELFSQGWNTQEFVQLSNHDLLQSFSVNPRLEPYKFFWDLTEIPSIRNSIISPGRGPIGIPVSDQRGLIAHLASTKLDCEGIESFLCHLENSHYDEIRRNMIHLSLDQSRPELLQRAFSAMTYLSSNNLLPSLQHTNFIDWAIKNDHVRSLSEFLQVKVPSMKSFIRNILFALSSSANSSSSIKPIHEFLFTNPSEFVNIVHSIHHRAFAGNLGTSLLYNAAGLGDVKMAELLIRLGANADGDAKYCPLIAAATNGAVNMLEWLIKAGADVNKEVPSRYSDGGTENALSVAVYDKHLGMVDLLLKAGAKVDVDMKIHRSPEQCRILWYAKRTSPKIYNSLKQHLGQDEISNTWLLVEEAQKGNRALCQFLLEKNIFEDKVLLERELCYAVKWGNLEAVKTLLSRGVDANAERFLHQYDKFDVNHESDRYSQQPLQAALQSPHVIVHKDIRPSIIYLLVRSGARLQHLLPNLPPHSNAESLMAIANAGHDMTEIGGSILEEIVNMNNGSVLHKCGVLIESGCPINCYGNGGKSVLQNAARRGHVALVEYLMERGAQVNFPACEKQGRTALQAAAEYGNFDVINCLLDAGANVRAPPAKEGGVTVLEAAATGCQSAFLNLYLRNDDCIQETKEKWKVLFRNLVGLGAPVNRNPAKGSSLIHRLVQSSTDTEILDLVLRAGAGNGDCLEEGFEPPLTGYWDNERRKFKFPRTALQLAAELRHTKAINLLTSHGANVNAPPAETKEGFTALQSAARTTWPSQFNYHENPTGASALSQQFQAVQLLLKAGADLNAPPSDINGRTALQAACSSKPTNYKVVSLLLENGAHINAPPAKDGGITALQGAIIIGDMGIVRTLLEHEEGADISAPPAPENGITAVEAAAKHGRLDILKLLLNKGALPDATGFSRAIQFAEENENWEIVDLLQEHRAFSGLEWSQDI